MTKSLKNTYNLLLSKEAEKDIACLPKSTVKLIDKVINERLLHFPECYGKPLSGNLKGYRRIRFSVYRIIYQVVGDTVNIVAIDHRRDIYRS